MLRGFLKVPRGGRSLAGIPTDEFFTECPGKKRIVDDLFTAKMEKKRIGLFNKH